MTGDPTDWIITSWQVRDGESGRPNMTLGLTRWVRVTGFVRVVVGGRTEWVPVPESRREDVELDGWMPQGAAHQAIMDAWTDRSAVDVREDPDGRRSVWIDGLWVFP